MKHILNFSLIVLITISLASLQGCSKQSPDEPKTEIESIDQEDGGFTTSQEPVDDYLVADFGADEDAEAGDLSKDPSIASLLDSTGLKVYYLRLTWGMLEWDSTATTITDWSGAATITRGKLVLLRTIRFESGEDWIVRPRTSQQELAWVSKTLYHFDGVRIAIIDKDTTDTPGTLTINMGPYSNTFTFAELDSMNAVVDVDAAGNQFSIVSRGREIVALAGGFLEGRWVKEENRDGGRFWGKWVQSNGDHAGYVKGIWGVNRQGNQVIFGKYFSKTGAFKGLLRGEWGYDNVTLGKGWFKGVWLNERRANIGTLIGTFNTKDDKGFFQGHWKQGR
jgi:hypothetical protein